VAPRRMCLFLGLVFLLFHVGGVVAYSVTIAGLSWEPATMPGFGGFWRSLEESRRSVLAAALAVITFEWQYRLGHGFRLAYVVHPAPAFTCLVTAMIPLTFVALPESLRACRVRRRHLVRILAYSLVPLPLLLMFPLWADLLVEWWASRAGYWSVQERVSNSLSWVQMLLAVLWQLLCWRAAVKHYLRMPHASGVALATTFIAAQIAAIVLLLTAGARLLMRFV
jgi:hypothetical protein